MHEPRVRMRRSRTDAASAPALRSRLTVRATLVALTLVIPLAGCGIGHPRERAESEKNLVSANPAGYVAANGHASVSVLGSSPGTT